MTDMLPTIEMNRLDKIDICCNRNGEECKFKPDDERRFDFCENNIDGACCPKGYTDTLPEEFWQIKGGEP